MMIDRPLLRDVALAVLLGLPTAALSRPDAPVPEHSAKSAPLVEQAAVVHLTSTERRFEIAS